MFVLIQITKEDVDRFETLEQEIPSCQVTAEWTKQDKKPSQFTYKVILEGAKAPDNYFCIVLDSIPPDTTKDTRGKCWCRPYDRWLLSATSPYSVHHS